MAPKRLAHHSILSYPIPKRYRDDAEAYGLRVHDNMYFRSQSNGDLDLQISEPGEGLSQVRADAAVCDAGGEAPLDSAAANHVRSQSAKLAKGDGHSSLR